MTDAAMRLDPTLQEGSKGEQVSRLQIALNSKVTGLNLRTDGEYDHATTNAVERFQDDNWLIISGKADRCTQNALFNMETYEPIRHVRPFMAQPTDTTCWATCTAMFKRSSVAAVIAATPPDLINADSALANVVEGNWREATQSFAYWHNLRFSGPVTWTTQKIVGMLEEGPIIVDTIWSLSDFSAAKPTPGHFTLVVGCRGDGQANGRGTTLMVFDPWPPKCGCRTRVTYADWVAQVSTRTYRIFY